MSVTTELSVAAEPTEVLLPVVNFVHRHRLGSIVAAIVEAHAPLVRVYVALISGQHCAVPIAAV